VTHFSHDYEQGIKDEQERIIKLLTDRRQDGESWLDLLEGCTCCQKLEQAELIELIKGEQKPIHTHDIEVFGAPCDCGTRHEYCGECDWVEPCEQEGEQK
jgi:hypothetical protein